MKEKAAGILRRAKRWAEDLLFPEATCICCACAPREALRGGLCEGCLRALEAQRMEQEAQPQGECPQELAFVHAAFAYEDPARRLIRALKYERVIDAAQPLIDAMTLLPSGEEELIVPVPTTKRRLKERGFNQALLLARGIGVRLGMQVVDALVRDGEQKAQAGLSGKARLHNLHGCMRAVCRLDGRKILLIDDVYTTGATAKEAARALYEAGAASVGVFVAARACGGEETPQFLRFSRSSGDAG